MKLNRLTFKLSHNKEIALSYGVLETGHSILHLHMILVSGQSLQWDFGIVLKAVT